MKMNEIGLCLANPPNQSRANGSRCQVTDSPHPRYLNSRIDGFGARPVIARNHDLNVHGFLQLPLDRKSTRLNSSHVAISYAVFCLKKKMYSDPHIPLHQTLS